MKYSYDSLYREIRDKLFEQHDRLKQKIRSYGYPKEFVLTLTYDRDVCVWLEVVTKESSNLFLLEKVLKVKCPDKTIDQMCQIANSRAELYERWLTNVYRCPVWRDPRPVEKEFKPLKLN